MNKVPDLKQSLLFGMVRMTSAPGGNRYIAGNFNSVGSDGIWWTATEDGSALTYNRDMNSGNSHVSEWDNYKGFGFSVRCVRG